MARHASTLTDTTIMKSKLLILCLVFICHPLNDVLAVQQPNVILIICDDLNDYVEGFGGHPQTQTPNIARLSKTGVTFTQAHCNIPICGPSRASLFTGIYPHHSSCFGFTKWSEYEVLKNSRTIMDHFRANGYLTLGTGKLMHHLVPKEWNQYGNPADYGPFALTGSDRVAHPDVPAPYREIGAVDGSFGPLVNISGRTNQDGVPFSWLTGGWGKTRTLNITTQETRDQTADELNSQWAVDRLKELAEKPGDQPFFMGVGFIRPHTPLVVPKRFFDQFPLDSIELPEIKKGDIEDTFALSIRGDVASQEPNSQRTMDMGSRLYQELVASYETREEALRRFIQAYLASVASVDELIGNIMDVVEQTSLADNTIVIVTSDHGWGMGEKDYLYKNSLWQESTRIPLVIRAPGISQPGSVSDHPVSLIDIYPTLVELCGLTGETMKNNKGRPLDGFSLKPFLEDAQTKAWDGPESALTALYKWRTKYNPAKENYSLRSDNYRYIRYENGKEELYQTKSDPHEWNNLATDPSHAGPLTALRSQLIKRIPTEEDSIPNQPVFKPKKPVQSKPPVRGKSATDKKTGEYWKNEYFKKHPDADTNGDGVLSWPERNAHNPKADSNPDAGDPSSKSAENKSDSSQPEKPMSDLQWKDHFFKLHPVADTNQDGDLSWSEYKQFKAELDKKKSD
tara:strand:- start:1221 stop:3266 length:2046 start_codon:yes stop_codon:yes gene_type:complete